MRNHGVPPVFMPAPRGCSVWGVLGAERGRRWQGHGNLARPGADCRPVSEIACWSPDRPCDEPLSQAESARIELAGEDEVRERTGGLHEVVKMGWIAVRLWVTLAERSAAKEPDRNGR